MGSSLNQILTQSIALMLILKSTLKVTSIRCGQPNGDNKGPKPSYCSHSEKSFVLNTVTTDSRGQVGSTISSTE